MQLISPRSGCGRTGDLAGWVWICTETTVYDCHVLYGRHAERAAIGALLEAARASKSSALVLRGEPGIGKSALLEDARDRAADMHVLSARGVESESELPLAALHQLLRPALTHLDQLPAPQAAALRGALGLDEGAAEERFLVFAACLSLLSELAERRPVLCLLDDAHWLDSGSADALSFVARRLGAEGIVMLFAAREGDVRHFDAPNVPSLMLEGLDSEAAATLLSRAAGQVAAPSVRDRLIEQTRGNALALVELPSALNQAQLAGEQPLPDALPLTRQVESVFLERVRRLSGDAQRLLLLASADDAGDAALVTRAALQLGTPARALDVAEQAALITVRGNRLEFRHPLVRSAIYEAATSSERREAHRALAEALGQGGDESDRRAWHLAASVLEPDENVVRALEEAAERAEERAGHMAAAKALVRAAELSTDSAARGRRLVHAARNLSLSGHDEQAVELANQAAPLVAEPSLVAELAHVRAMAAIRCGRPHEIVQVLVAASREVASLQPARTIELLMDATAAAWQGGDQAAFLEIAELAGTVVPPAGDEASSFIARSLAGYAAMLNGETAKGVDLLGELAAWGGRADEARHVLWASYGPLWLGDEELFGQLVERALALARERGEVGTLADALGTRAAQLTIAQRFDDASVVATEAIQLARELGAENLELLPRGALAVVAAVHGRDDEARRHGDEVLELATSKGLRLRASLAIHGLALVDLGRARWADALERLDSLLVEAGPLDPAVSMTIPDKIEAAVRAGKPEDARAAFPLFESWAGYTSAPLEQPRLAACRAQLATGEEATRHFETALELIADARPFDRLRIHLLYGEHLRRERRRVDAREHLRTAQEGFERLRAEPWAERARAELRASGETARKRDPSTIDQLTPQEVQIARLVAEGHSNKEVAAQLFLSPRTIDYHLRNVFAKLEITSRTQLARFALGGEEAATPMSVVAPA